jgi:pilus assembly protein Flp/PilA
MIRESGKTAVGLLKQETWTMTFFRKLIKDTEGATAIEYGLIAALIAVAAITAMGALGNSLGNTFNLVSNDMNNASDGKL